MKLRPHQLEAVEAAVRGLNASPRGQIIMPCGTGKTLVGVELVRRMLAHQVLVLVPSIALVKQVIEVYRRELPGAALLAVCSDETVGRDAARVSLSELPCQVTTYEEVAANFLHDDGPAVRIVVATYHSSRVLDGFRFDLAIFDEAHRTAGEKGKAFAFALDDENVRCARRVFMTATPRHADVSDLGERPVYSMDDAAAYGPVFYSLPFRDAIRRGLICDYRIVISQVAERPRDRAGLLDMREALAQAMRKFGARKAFTFHSTISDAKAFAACTPGATHVNGGMESTERAAILDQLREADGGVVTNVACLGEGVDAPDVDLVAFMTPKRSKVDIVQTTGRALRLSAGKRRALIFVPLFIQEGAESIEDGVKRAQFGHVWDVLQALREQDEVLCERLSRLAAPTSGDGDPIQGPTDDDIVQVIGRTPALGERLYRAVSVRMVGPWAVAAKKAELLRMARSGEARPSHKTKLGSALCDYIAPSGGSYDAAFDAEIRQAAPSWFVGPSERAAAKKAELLRMARSGQARPSHKTKLGSVLRDYTAPSKNSYDAAFDTEIRQAAPSWFAVHNPAAKKAELLRMARAGDPRPTQKTKLGWSLRNYTVPSSDAYDAAFGAEIRQAAPHWFKKGSNDR